MKACFCLGVLARFPLKQRRTAERSRMGSQAAVGVWLTTRVPQGRGPSSSVSLERDVSVNFGILISTWSAEEPDQCVGHKRKLGSQMA